MATQLPTTPSSVIQSDSFLMRTRWGNWVSDGGFIVTDEEMAGAQFMVIFDADPDADPDDWGAFSEVGIVPEIANTSPVISPAPLPEEEDSK